MTSLFKLLFVSVGAICMAICASSCDSEQPEPTINQVVKRTIKPEEIPFDPAVQWKSPLTPTVEAEPLPIPEPYPDLIAIIENAPAWEGGFSPLFQDAAVVPEEPATAEEPAPSPKPENAPEPDRGPYVILLGTFVHKQYADKGVSEFSSKGLSVYLERFTYNNKEYYGIFHGGFDDSRQAKRAGPGPEKARPDR